MRCRALRYREYVNPFASLRKSVRMRPSRNLRNALRKISRKSSGICCAGTVRAPLISISCSAKELDAASKPIHALVGRDGLRQQTPPPIRFKSADKE